jgi:hypothetical protein
MSNGDPEEIRDRPADPQTESPAPPDPDGPITILGFWDGNERLYRSKDLRSYVRIRPEEVESFGRVDQNSVPFLGEHATWVKLGPDAHVEFVRTGPVPPADDFEVEARFGGSARAISVALGPWSTWICTIKKLDPDWPWPTFPFPPQPHRDTYYDR